jgi:hypothetical protein
MSSVKSLSTALLALLAVAVGCGDEPSSTVEETDSPATERIAVGEAVGRPGGRPTGGDAVAKPEHSEKKEKSAERLRPRPVPTGVPLDPRDPRVRKAIADLLDPPRRDDSHPPTDGGKPRDGGLRGILNQLLQGENRESPDSTERESPDSTRQDQAPKPDGDGLGAILDQLK